MEHVSGKRGFLFIGLMVCLALGVMVASLNGARPVSANESMQYENDQLVVRLAPATSIADFNASYQTTTLKALRHHANIYLLQAPPGIEAEQLIHRVSGDSRVVYAELNLVGSAPEASASDIFGWPSDSIEEQEPRQAYEWEWAGFSNGRYYEQPAVHAVRLSQAHDVSQGAGVTVAVLDTGINLAHPALAGSLVAGYDFVDEDPFPEDEANGLDDDGDGFVDEVAGHGTHVAGIVHLVAPAAQIMPLRVLNSDGQGDVFGVADAILYAVHHGAQVINLSLGTTTPSALLQDVINQVTAEGVVVVAAAGNLDSTQPQYPAAFSCVLAVTSVGPGPNKSNYASYGTWISVAAPGERVYSTYPDGGYAWWKGTSMATPFVAGQAALIRSVSPSLSIEGTGALIAETAYAVDKQNRPYAGLLGAGRVDIGKSLKYLAGGSWAAGTFSPLQNCGSS